MYNMQNETADKQEREREREMKLHLYLPFVFQRISVVMQ